MQLGIDLREQGAAGVGFSAVDGVEEREVGHGRLLPGVGAGGEAKVGQTLKRRSSPRNGGERC